MSRKARVEYVQNSEPAFIRQFKQRAGIPISDTVDSKRSQLPHDDGDHGDRPEARAFLADCAIKEKAKVDPKNDGSSELSSVAGL
ncbi:unnamed protein product [Echinostoma caproni]|uniref:DUF4604 domain-containing protein n=1 Tax=Echinostoma caproni TaxID=27848 RepID=A0A183APM0_9TREM|nr:unnamed protein product [Echinostoma caproni]